MLGYGITVKDKTTTMRNILIEDDKYNMCLNLLFETPNDKWAAYREIGNSNIIFNIL